MSSSIDPAERVRPDPMHKPTNDARGRQTGRVSKQKWLETALNLLESDGELR